MKMKKVLFSLLISINLFASGIPVVDVASIAQAVMNYGQQLKDYSMQLQQYEQMYSQLQQQMHMVRMQVQNLQSLKQYDWKDLGTILYQARNVMNKVDGISYDVKNTSKLFEKIYGNYDDYFKIFQDSKNENERNKMYSDKYDEILTKNQNTLKGTMEKLNLIESDFENETKIIAKLKQRSQTSQGALEVAQAGNDLIAYQIEEARKLRTVMMDQSNMIANHFAQENNKEILNKAKDDKLKMGVNTWEGKTNPDAFKQW